MATYVAPNAEVSPEAQLDDEVYVGPFCVIGPDVTIGRGTRLENSVSIMGWATIGADNRIFPGAVVGGDPQDLSYRNTRTRVVIGHRNVIRECVTINRGTEKEDGVTSIGNECFIMGCCHIAHDCKLGDRVVMANASLLGGHVHVAHDVTLSGGVAVHHFASIGCYSFVSGLSRVLHDVPPYMLVEGSPARPRCVNTVALKRNAFPSDVVRALIEAHRVLYRAKAGLEPARETLREKGMLVPAVNHLLGFVQNQHEGRHGRGRQRRRAA
ncbi:MAG: acyl-ACP--UDP-N-acetylglucosamine O-acyltransferase [Planctomycetes bacterium]|nr:acyl-ACP--UDP-N-acetylglucosamine O-acyltransferase [Planctomycetota bacterium]